MKRYDRVTVGWRVLGKTKNEYGVESITSLSRIFHVRDAAISYQQVAAQKGFDCWITEVTRPERKELGVK